MASTTITTTSCLLVSPGHQQPWYCIYWIIRSVVISIVVQRTIFVCAILLRWVPIFLHTVYSAKFCLHWCRWWPRLSYMFKMLSVDWYVRKRNMHVHPVLESNSRCRLASVRHLAKASCLTSPVSISSYRQTQDEHGRFSISIFK